jgi:TonB family protein
MLFGSRARAVPADPGTDTEHPTPVAASALVPPVPKETPVEYPDGGEGEAEVMLDLTIGADGKVAGAVVISGEAPFAQAAVEAVRAWRFEPARRDGRAVPARIRYTLRFEPSPDEPTKLTSGGEPASGRAEPARGETAPAAGEPVEVIVRGAPRTPGSVTLLSSDVRSMPGAFGDPLRTVEAQPGVVPIVSGVPSFFIRGAPPANVGFFIDGIDVPLLYHAFLGPSVVHPNVIGSVEFYRGAAPVEYGRFAGPTVAANLHPFDRSWHAEGNLRLIDVGGFAGGPLGSCERPEAECSTSQVRASARYSYTGLVLSLLSDAELHYWDYQGEVRYALGPRDSIGVFGFGAYDFFQGGGDIQQEAGGGQVTFHRADLRWDHRFSSRSHTRFAVTGGYDRTSGTESDSTSVSDRSVRARLETTTALADEATLRAGADARVDAFQLQTRPLTLSFPDFSVLFPTRTDFAGGAYLGVELAPTPAISVVPGVRADVYRVSGVTAVGVDPRILATFAVSSRVILEHSFGFAHQRPNFAAQVPGAQVADLSGGLQEAVLWSSGIKWRLPGDVTAAATVFRNGYFDALDPIGGQRDFTLDRTILNRRSTIAAAGLEIGITRPLTKDVGGFLSYTLSRSEQSSGRVHSVSGFDRPHVLQAALSYAFGAGFRAGARAVLYSGVPELNLEGSPHFTTQRRGDPYFRLDLRVEKRWRLGQSGFWGATAEILNATSTREVIRLDCGSVCVERFAGPLILPSVGVEAGF